MDTLRIQTWKWLQVMLLGSILGVLVVALSGCNMGTGFGVDSGHAGNLPSGSWRDSCRNGVRYGTDLYAQCQAANGSWRDTSLDLNRCPRGPVGNDNGRLFCEGY